MLVFAPVAYISTRIILSFIILSTSSDDNIKIFDSVKHHGLFPIKIRL